MRRSCRRPKAAQGQARPGGVLGRRHGPSRLLRRAFHPLFQRNHSYFSAPQPAALRRGASVAVGFTCQVTPVSRCMHALTTLTGSEGGQARASHARTPEPSVCVSRFPFLSELFLPPRFYDFRTFVRARLTFSRVNCVPWSVGSGPGCAWAVPTGVGRGQGVME